MSFAPGVLSAPSDLRPDLLGAIREHLPGKAGSTAIVDWTSLDHACVLMEQALWDCSRDSGPRERLTFGGSVDAEEPEEPSGPSDPRYDPFIALGDFASVASALILHDRVLVLATRGHALAERARELFGLPPDVICDMPLSLPSGPEYDDPGDDRDAQATRFGEVLDSVWFWARVRFDAAVRHDEAWYRALCANWQRLLPGTRAPSHDADEIERLLGPTYVPSPGRAPPVIFHQNTFAWAMKPNDSLAKLILDNDVRGLFYEGLAVQLQQLCEGDADAPTIKYLGGCLRGPLQLAYADTSQLARDAVAIERRIEASWLDIADSSTSPVRLPVWIDALLSTVPEDPSGVAERVGHWRERASAFRRRRQELEAQLAHGDVATAKEIQQALRLDLKALGNATANAGAETVKMGVRAVAPPAADLAAAGAHAVMRETGAGGWLRLGWLRVRRPHLWVITDMGRQALSGRNSFHNASAAFGFPPGVADEMPAGFFSRLGRMAWVA